MADKPLSLTPLRICYPGFLSPVGSEPYNEWAKTIRNHKFKAVPPKANEQNLVRTNG
jgi:hypothetical protein